MNTSNNNLAQFLRDKFIYLRKFIRKRRRIVLPVLVGLLVIIVLIISITVHNKKKDKETEEANAPAVEEIPGQISSDMTAVAIPEVALEEDAYPEVNELFNRYYGALASGDIETIKQINNKAIDDTEALRITETSKYVDHYSNIKVYTKLGPSAGTYLAYVYSEVRFTDYDADIPGLEAFYVCSAEDGSLYINDGEESDSVINYIRETSLQDDVVDLNNEVAVAYNNMLTEDENLSLFLVDLTDSINTAIGESLAQAEGSETAKPEEGQTDTQQEGSESVAEIKKEVVTTVKATTTVNIRSSDSETADKLGKASEGQEFKLIEKKGNGWSEIDYNGKSAFIKSEFLEDANTETVISVAGDDTSNTTDTQTQQTTNNTTTAANDQSTTTQTGTTQTTKAGDTVMVKENVRIRESASTDSEKIATVYMGEKLEFVEKMSNGWTKVKYKGQIGYVKSEYVE